MPRPPIQSPPPPPSWEWTSAHTEGLKGLGRGLMQDYQQGMDYLGGLSEHPAVQGLGFLLPLMGGVVTKFPADASSRAKFMRDRGFALSEKLENTLNYLGDPGEYGLWPAIKGLTDRANKATALGEKIRRKGGPWHILDPEGNSIRAFGEPRDAYNHLMGLKIEWEQKTTAPFPYHIKGISMRPVKFPDRSGGPK